MPRLTTRDLVLAGSIAANLVLAGFVIGAGVRLAGPGAPPAEPPRVETRVSPRALIEQLSPEQRRAMREAFVGEGLRSAPLFRELRDARGDFDAAVRAEPFDAEGARGALDRVREAERQLQERGNEMMVEILADLPVEERERVLNAMRERGRRFIDRDRRGRDGAPDADRPNPESLEPPR
jgi:uncharacterized membrane protein